MLKEESAAVKTRVTTIWGIQIVGPTRISELEIKGSKKTWQEQVIKLIFAIFD